MREILFFAMILLAYPATRTYSTVRQNVVTRIEGNGSSWVMSYSEDGLLTAIIDGQEQEGASLWTYDYNTFVDGWHYVIQCSYTSPGDGFPHTSQGPTFIRESRLNDDHLISNDRNGNTFMWSTGHSFSYDYDDDRIVKMTDDHGMTAELSWTEGNLTQIIIKEDDEEAGRITCSYSDISSDEVCQAITSPLLLLLDYYNILPVGPLAQGCYGMLCNKLLSDITMSFTDEFTEKHSEVSSNSGDYYPMCKKKSMNYAYETDAKGDIKKIIVREGENETEFLLYYEEDAHLSCLPTALPNDGPSLTVGVDGRRITKRSHRGVVIQDGRKVLKLQ